MYLQSQLSTYSLHCYYFLCSKYYWLDDSFCLQTKDGVPTLRPGRGKRRRYASYNITCCPRSLVHLHFASHHVILGVVLFATNSRYVSTIILLDSELGSDWFFVFKRKCLLNISGMRIRSDPLILGLPDPWLYSLDTDPTCNNGFIKFTIFSIAVQGK